MIEVRSLQNEQGEELLELRFPKDTNEEVWAQAYTAYEGFHSAKFKAYEIPKEVEVKFTEFAKNEIKPQEVDQVSWIMTLWLRFLHFMGMG
jgi:hypothetical protein